MASETIKYAGIKLTIDGAAEFQKTLTEINSGLKLSQAELSKSTAEYGKNSNSMEALTAKQQHLEKSLALNKQEQAALNEMLDKATAQYGENSTEVERLKTKLTESEAAQIRIQKALDETTKAIKGQSWTELGKNIEAVGKKMQDMGSKLSDIGGTLTEKVTVPIAAGVAAIVAAFGALSVKALNLGGELEQNLGGAEAVFGEFANAVKEKGTEAFKLMGVSQSDFLATANKMGALMQGSGIDIKESMDLSTQAMQRAADVASIMGVDIGDAMEAVTGAAKGNFTMMDNLGVAMNATTIEAYALSKGITTTYSNMDNAEKTQLAMEMFLEKTAYATGNYAKENETLAGSLGTAKAAMTNFLSGAGDVDSLVAAFANAADVIVNNISEMLPRLTTGISELIQKISPKIPELISALLPEVIKGGISLIAGLADVLPETISILGTSIIAALNTSITDQAPKLLTGIQSILDAFANIDGTIVLAFAGVAAAIGPVVSAIGSVMSVTGELSVAFGVVATKIAAAGGLIPALAGLAPVLLPIAGVIAGVAAAGVLLYQNWDLVKEKAKALYEFLKPTFEAIQKFFTDWAKEVAPIFSDAFENIKKLAEEIFNKIKEFWDKWGNTIKTCFETLFNNVKIIVSTAFEVIKTVINTALNIISTVINVFTSALKGDWQGAWDSITKIFSTALEGIKSICGTLLNGILDLFRNSISGMISIGADIIGGLIEGLKSKTDAVKNTVTSMISGFTDSIKSFFGISSPSKLMKQYFSWVGEGMVIGLKSQADELIKTSKSISENVADNLQIDPTELIKNSKDVLENMQNALPEMKSNINHVVQAQTTQGSSKQSDIIITGNQFIVREDSDIQKIAKEVMRQINQSVNRNSRIGGIALT